MTNWRCGALVIARDEEKNIENCLKSLRNQTVKLFLAVVNDGSIDKTREFASRFANVVVDLPRHEESWAGQPYLARVFNAGFHILEKEYIDFILISGADATYPSNYVEEIIGKMESENTVLASGIAEGETSRSMSPRGAGRVINAEWFSEIGFRYPENYGFEAYIVYKAVSQGRRVIVFTDLRFKLSRKTKFSKKKLYLWGKGMKALNYWWLYAFGRAFVIGLRNPTNGYEILRGYLSKVSQQYDDVKDFVSKFQKKMFLKRFGEVFAL